MNGDRYEHKAIIVNPGSMAERARAALGKLGQYVQQQERARLAIDDIQTRSVMTRLRNAEQYSRNLTREAAKKSALAGELDLWTGVARFLSGSDVVVKWGKPNDPDYPNAEGLTFWPVDGKSPTITVDPNLDRDARFRCFLHETAHVKHFCENGTKSSSPDRERLANVYRDLWLSFSEKNYLKYARGGSEEDCKLLALLHYNPLGGG